MATISDAVYLGKDLSKNYGMSALQVTEPWVLTFWMHLKMLIQASGLDNLKRLSTTIVDLLQFLGPVWMAPCPLLLLWVLEVVAVLEAQPHWALFHGLHL